MKITMDQYIVNPMGKRNAVMNAVAREAIAADYLKRYGRLMMREHSIMNHTLYIDKKNNRYIAHIKVPSETVPKFYYDIVLEFTANEDVKAGGEDLFKYNCRFFSNDPAFVYTYAHVFKEDDIFYTDLRSKMSKLALKKSPTETNPSNTVGYVKTIYFAYLFMKARDLNNRSKFTAQAIPMSLKRLISEVEDADDKITKRQEEGDKLRKEKQKEKRNEEKSVQNTKKVNNTSAIKPIKKVEGIKKVNTINRIKSVLTSKKKKQ
ncbi:MAG: hypothetical protein IKR19_08295 [Acholeplasmatales bacterium]|nr:hypothetical protein [Acholeplasmatales bacterium]